MKNQKPKPGNNEPKKELVFAMQINYYADNTSEISFDRQGIILAQAREILTRHAQMFTDQIILHSIDQKQKTRIITPANLPLNMKLKQ